MNHVEREISVGIERKPLVYDEMSSLTTLRHNFLRLQIIVIKIIIIIVVVVIVKVCVIIKLVHFLLTAFGAPTVRLIWSDRL